MSLSSSKTKYPSSLKIIFVITDNFKTKTEETQTKKEYINLNKNKVCSTNCCIKQLHSKTHLVNQVPGPFLLASASLPHVERRFLKLFLKQANLTRNEGKAALISKPPYQQLAFQTVVNFFLLLLLFNRRASKRLFYQEIVTKQTKLRSFSQNILCINESMEKRELFLCRYKTEIQNNLKFFTIDKGFWELSNFALYANLILTANPVLL